MVAVMADRYVSYVFGIDPMIMLANVSSLISSPSATLHGPHGVEVHAHVSTVVISDLLQPLSRIHYEHLGSQFEVPHQETPGFPNGNFSFDLQIQRVRGR